ncbi:hypothetical protein APHNP_0539 [Anaplasma phagocytophilum str. ApNP]|uniref:Uncharacterized protein n=2 Tax=Anaplasma phagocytophilum TaxID=948 RepID=A0A0F3NF48_ANAPH|nr:hypothetical protein APHMUC_0737 [Anaplasma phagocytophilum str. ApMUC09]KJV66645.1 hypothetical protein APHNP_0539 [Anaplasma phagocytophilum str. ApNP]
MHQSTGRELYVVPATRYVYSTVQANNMMSNTKMCYLAVF